MADQTKTNRPAANPVQRAWRGLQQAVQIAGSAIFGQPQQAYVPVKVKQSQPRRHR